MKNILSLIVIATLMSAPSIFSKESWKEKSAARQEASSASISDRVFVGLDHSLFGNAGFSFGKSIGSDALFQMIALPFSLTKVEGADAQTAFKFGGRFLKTVKRVNDVNIQAGLGINFVDFGSTSELYIEAPLRFEYFVGNRVSLHLVSGINLDLNILQDAEGWSATLGGAGAGISIYL
jgi:hypothetical protein